MSGGHYDYAHGHLERFIDELMLKPRPPDPGWSPEELGIPEPVDPYVNYELRQRFKEHLIKVSAAMKAIEWNDSGDGARDESERILACLQGPDLGEP